MFGTWVSLKCSYQGSAPRFFFSFVLEVTEISLRAAPSY